MIQGIGTDGPVNWVLDALRIDWRAAQVWTVSRLEMSLRIAWGIAILAEIARHWMGIGKERDPSVWWTVVAFLVATIVLSRTLPKE